MFGGSLEPIAVNRAAARAWLCLALLGCVCGWAVVGCAPATDTAGPGTGPGAAGSGATGQAAAAGAGGVATEVKTATLGSTKPVFLVDQCYLAGQPQAEDFAAIKAAGVTKVISVRGEGEIDWDARAAAEAAGLEYFQIPVGSPEELTEEKIAQVCALLKTAKEADQTVVLHCGVAARASAVWMAFHCLEQQGSWEESEALVAQMVRLPDYWKAPVKAYVEKAAAQE